MWCAVGNLGKKWKGRECKKGKALSCQEDSWPPKNGEKVLKVAEFLPADPWFVAPNEQVGLVLFHRNEVPMRHLPELIITWNNHTSDGCGLFCNCSFVVESSLLFK